MMPSNMLITHLQNRSQSSNQQLAEAWRIRVWDEQPNRYLGFALVKPPYFRQIMHSAGEKSFVKKFYCCDYPKENYKRARIFAKAKMGSVRF